MREILSQHDAVPIKIFESRPAIQSLRPIIICYDIGITHGDIVVIVENEGKYLIWERLLRGSLYGILSSYLETA